MDSRETLRWRQMDSRGALIKIESNATPRGTLGGSQMDFRGIPWQGVKLTPGGTLEQRESWTCLLTPECYFKVRIGLDF